VKKQVTSGDQHQASSKTTTNDTIRRTYRHSWQWNQQ
jgi:hypothetical protein